MKRLIPTLAVALLFGFAACDSVTESLTDGAPSNSSGTDVPYTGQGFNDDGTLGEEICGIENGAEVDGPYLLWVFTATGADSATITGPWGTAAMTQSGPDQGAFKYVSEYYDLEDLGGVYATYYGSTQGNPQLVVSHGCPPGDEELGAWCSPGYWRNASDAAWALTGYAKTDLFNETVVPSFYAHQSAANPTLIQVLTTSGANTFGSAADPFGLNAFNATGAFLTDALDGYKFDPVLMGEEYEDLQVCPLDRHGNLDPDYIYFQ